MLFPSDNICSTPRSGGGGVLCVVPISSASSGLIGDIGLLDVVNSLLGLSVLALLAIVLLRMIADASLRMRRKKDKGAPQGELVEMLNRLGITMHDGGEKLEENHTEADE